MKIEKFEGLTKIPFHVFDRYEIHIQAFANVVYGKFIIFNPHLRKSIENIYSFSRSLSTFFSKHIDTFFISYIQTSKLINIILDPGLAFGTGAHPTTHLCTEWLIDNVSKEKKVLDYGCGSGILAIAAFKLGAKMVKGVDIDPQAIIASKQNGNVNKCNIDWLNTNEDFKFQADLLVANILSSALSVLAPLLASYCAPKGKIALSGILESQENQIKKIYEPWFNFEKTLKNNGWVCLSGVKV